MPEKYNHTFTLRITDKDAHAVIRKIAEQQERSENFIINVALKEYAARHRKEVETVKVDKQA